MIPKKIHYCWFGGNPLPNDAKKYIESWKKYLPDYEIIEWNENNFDINCCDYVREAYESKKWAFVSDYARLFVMVNYGGIYMDTDVEVVKNLDEFLVHQAFSGFENDICVPTGIMACEKDYPLFKKLLNDYNNKHFINADGSLNQITNVVTITDEVTKRGFKPNNKFQVIDGFALYPKDYFCPKNQETGEIESTKNTATIHHFSGTWIKKEEKQAYKIVNYFKKKNMPKLGMIFAFPLLFIAKCKDNGFINSFKSMKKHE